MRTINEAILEENLLKLFEELNYEVIYSTDEKYLVGGLFSLRDSYEDVLLINRLRNSLIRINPSIPIDLIDAAIKEIQRIETQNLILDNETFHKFLVNGISLPELIEGEERHKLIRLIDFDEPLNNDFLVINQFTVKHNNLTPRRPDVVVFINGFPIALFELKNPADEDATIDDAFNQIQTYKEQIPSLFKYNEIIIISDGWDARSGTLTSKFERFMQWKTIDGEKIEENLYNLEILVKGMFKKERLLDIICNFIVFEKDKFVDKKLATYHQYWATNRAVQSTLRASGYILKKIPKEKYVSEPPESFGLSSVNQQPIGDRKAGVVWHTQGSGKSLTMIFYAAKIIKEMDNPTIVVLTDRNDLDDQLFGTFCNCQDILRQSPSQAETRKDLFKLLKVDSGGIVFTTIQKFYPESENNSYPLLSDRENIIVIADEAHRSQYGFHAKINYTDDEPIINYGFAKYVRDALPNATFIGFTGTPIEKIDKSTPAVFGNYVDIYDIEQSIIDGATVRIYYESRLAKLELNPEERPNIDEEFEEVTEGEEITKKEKLKSKWSQLEKVAGTPERIKRIARDIIEHFENRLSIIDGKGMIVCMSRRICIEIYNEIIKLRPHWHSDEDDKGFVKVVITGSASDPVEWQNHIRNKIRRKRIGDNFKNPEHETKLLIVRDMFLTGYDVPCLHTMYIDKPMQGHTLMQAIARVNRVYPGKEGGLIVDYMGIGMELKKALINYTESGGKGKVVLDQEEAVKIMIEKFEIIKDMFHDFDYRKFFQIPTDQRMQFMNNALEHILKEESRKLRFIIQATSLEKAYSIAIPHPEALKIGEDVEFFNALKTSLIKTSIVSLPQKKDYETAIKQILSKAVISDRVIDIFKAAGIRKPEISILSEEFLLEVKEMPQKNLALEALKKLLNDEIKIILKKNLVKGKAFSEMLEETIKKYTNRIIEAAQVIEELIILARKIRDERNRGQALGLSDEELAFYDALEVNDSAVKILGDATLKKIALELTKMIRSSVTLDWTKRESVQAQLRLKVKRILKKYGYPPDKQKKATDTVLKQAELFAESLL